MRWEWASQQKAGRGDFMYSRNGRKQNKMNNVKHNYVKIRVLSVLFRFRSKSHTFSGTFKNHVYDEWMTSNGNHGKTGVEMLPHSLRLEENRKLLSLLWKKWWYKMDFISLLAECDLRKPLFCFLELKLIWYSGMDLLHWNQIHLSNWILFGVCMGLGNTTGIRRKCDTVSRPRNL